MTSSPRDPAALKLVTRSVHSPADRVVSIELGAGDGSPLPGWTPGAHIDLHLPSGRVRSYSLHGDPRDRSSYQVAVLKVEHGRGGSAEVHRIAAPGTELPASVPLNSFSMEPASHYLFIAGGIGVTPLLPMALAGDRGGGGGGARLAAPARSFAPLPAGAAAYCCGPAGMLAAAADAGASARPDVAVRVERFGAPADPAAGNGDRPFEVELARSGVTIEVPAGVSVLDAVRARIGGVMSNCEQGICSSCETAVLAGTPDHRDSVLTPKEKAAGRSMMICVSRSLTPRLVLDL